MLLQEYLPGTRPVAVNELAVVHYLMGGQLPAQKWLAAVSPLTDRLPVVPLLGGHLGWMPALQLYITSLCNSCSSGRSRLQQLLVTSS